MCWDFRFRENCHLSDDKAVAKIGHPDLDVGHPSDSFADVVQAASFPI